MCLRVFTMVIATMLTIGHAHSQVAVGKLDKSRPTEQEFEESTTQKADSFTIPAEAVVKQNETAIEARLREIKGRANISMARDTGSIVSLSAQNLAQVDKEAFDKGDQRVIGTIVNVLKENKVIFGDYAFEDLDLRIQRVLTGLTSTKVVFAQYVDDVPVEPSHATVSNDGQLSILMVRIANPNHPHFSRKSWIATEVLVDLACEASGLATSREKVAEETLRYEIILDPTTETFRPALIVLVGHLHVAVDAITGELIYARSEVVGSLAPFGPYICDETFPQKVTTSLPGEFVVSGGAASGAVRGCNSPGCGD
jgi:hypothetical protein